MKRIHAAVAVATLCLAGCSSPAPPAVSPSSSLPTSNKRVPKPAAPGPAASKPLSATPALVNLGDPVVTDSDIDTVNEAIATKAEQLLQSAKYAPLEALAAQYRHSQASLPDGTWKLTRLYNALGFLPYTSSEQDWIERYKQIEAWVKKNPHSTTARVLQIRILQSGAALSRGNNWGQSVTKGGWRSMAKMLAMANTSLRAAVDIRKQCPGWYSAAQGVALLEKWPRKNYDSVVNEGVRQYPSYSVLHFARVKYLLPRWHGQPGEAEQYAAQAADKLGGEKGDMLYAQVVWALQQEFSAPQVLPGTRFSYPRAKKGYTALMKRYPHSLAVASAYAELASYQGDRATARELFQNHIKNRLVLSFWGAASWFLTCRKWALSR